jgi:hypothetical protein
MINRLPKQFTVGGAETTRPGDPPAAESRGLQGVSDKILSAAADCVGKRPVASLSVAFAVGLALGKLVKR